MTKLSVTLLATLAAYTNAVLAAPAVTKALNLEKRAICTFRGTDGATEASPSKVHCGTIVISDMVVPSGHPLDLPGLNDNAHV
jgi:hypothetical protein